MLFAEQPGPGPSRGNQNQNQTQRSSYESFFSSYDRHYENKAPIIAQYTNKYQNSNSEIREESMLSKSEIRNKELIENSLTEQKIA